MMAYRGSSTAMSNAVATYSRAVEVLSKKDIDITRVREIEGRFQRTKDNLVEACR